MSGTKKLRAMKFVCRFASRNHGIATRRSAYEDNRELGLLPTTLDPIWVFIRDKI